MSQIITTDDLIDEVRSMLDEDNRISIDDAADILPALNRAQNYAASILARHYESPMLKYISVTPTSDQDEYFIPEDAFEQRLEKVEVKVGNLYYPVTRIDFRDVSLFEAPDDSKGSHVSYYYAVVGNRYRVLPKANAIYPLRIWYLEDPMPLAKSQGRITHVNTANNFVIVDTTGSDITTETDNLNSYVNIIDAQTGRRKATFQIQNINSGTITFKTTPSRTTVRNIAIDTDMTNLLVNSDTNNEGPDVSIEPDDYISVISGTAVPFFKKPFSNFLVQYAIAELRRKLGEGSDLEMRVLKELEAQVERSWVGRESSLRVDKSNKAWNLSTRRYYGPRG